MTGHHFINVLIFMNFCCLLNEFSLLIWYDSDGADLIVNEFFEFERLFAAGEENGPFSRATQGGQVGVCRPT